MESVVSAAASTCSAMGFGSGEGGAGGLPAVGPERAVAAAGTRIGMGLKKRCGLWGKSV